VGSITATADPYNGRVRLDVNWQDFPQVYAAWVYRLVNGSVMAVRGGNQAALNHQLAVLYDTELPLDTPVSYRTSIALNINGSFESGVAEWVYTSPITSPTGGTLVQDLSYYVAGAGVASAKLTPDGATAAVWAASDAFPAVVGTSYTATVRLMVPTLWAGGLQVSLAWYTSAHAFVSESLGTLDTTPIPGVFGTYTVTATAPATTAEARLVFYIKGTPPNSIPVYADEAYVTTAAGTVDSSTVLVASQPVAWLKSPTQPAYDLRLLIDPDPRCASPRGVWLAGLTDKSRPPDGAALEIQGAANPVAIWATRKSARSSLRLVSRATADSDAVKAINASGAPLFLQLPTSYGEPDQYLMVGETAEGRLATDHRVPWRAHVLPFVCVKAPVGPAEGVLGVRYQDLSRYADFATIDALNFTVLDTMQRTVANGWGTPDIGPGAYTTSGGAASDYSMSPGTGVHSNGTVNVRRETVLGVSLADLEIVVPRLYTSAAAATGAPINLGVSLRRAGANDMYWYFISIATSGAVSAVIAKIVAGVVTALSTTVVAGLTHAANMTYGLRAKALGTSLSIKVWGALVLPGAEPAAYTGTVVDASIAAAGGISVQSRLETGNTNTTPTTSYELLEVPKSPLGLTGIQVLQGAAS
jgi:hypothetical protein